jgi:Holliday junction resolvase
MRESIKTLLIGNKSGFAFMRGCASELSRKQQIPHAIHYESECELNPALSLWSTSQIKMENLIQQLGSD